MTARTKIEGLTNAWYGYALFAALITIAGNLWYGLFSWGFFFGLGVLSMAFAVGLSIVGFAVSVAITRFCGQKLLARSTFARAALSILSVVLGALCAYATLVSAWELLHTRSIAGLIQLALTASLTSLYARSFSVLNDAEVRSYCRGG